MVNSSAASPTGTVTSANEQESGDGGPPTGINILLVIIYSGMVGIMCVLFVQRLLLRIAPKYSKGYSDVTKHVPKNLREDIHKRLMQTLNIHYHPTLLSADDHRNQSLPNDTTAEASTPYNYLYRMKVLDGIKKLEDNLCKHDVSLMRPSHKGLGDHLRELKSSSSGVLKNVQGKHIKVLVDNYEHARYKQETYSMADYDKFADVLAGAMATIEHKSKKKRSVKKQAARKNTNSSNGASPTTSRLTGLKSSDTEPLIQGLSGSKC